MPRYIVQRTFPEAGTSRSMGAGLTCALASVVERNAEEGVTWISSFVSDDKTRTFCVYDAPTPEAIRKAAPGNELPIDQITQIRVPDPYFYMQASRHTKEDIMFTFSKPAPTAAVTTTRRPAGKSGTSAQVRRRDLPDTTGSPAPARADEHHDLADRGAHAGGAPPWDSRSGGTGMDSGLGWLSFQRIVDVHSKRAWPHLRAGSERDTTALCRSATAGSAGRSGMIATRVAAGSMCAWPGDRCARCCA